MHAEKECKGQSAEQYWVGRSSRMTPPAPTLTPYAPPCKTRNHARPGDIRALAPFWTLPP
eukprot:7072513-Pyramimonas_sp.AAC.2